MSCGKHKWRTIFRCHSCPAEVVMSYSITGEMGRFDVGWHEFWSVNSKRGWWLVWGFDERGPYCAKEFDNEEDAKAEARKRAGLNSV